MLISFCGYYKICRNLNLLHPNWPNLWNIFDFSWFCKRVTHESEIFLWHRNIWSCVDSFLASLLVQPIWWLRLCCMWPMKENEFISQQCVCYPAACLIDLKHISLINLLETAADKVQTETRWQLSRLTDFSEKLLVDDHTENTRPVVVMRASAWATHSVICLLCSAAETHARKDTVFF